MWPDETWKIARHCGAKHISKTKCTKHTRSGALLEVEMSKKCTPLWREARFQVKMYKASQSLTTFGSWDVEKVHAVVARSALPSQNVKETTHVRSTFGSWDVEKVHAVVARSTFRSQHVKNTTCSEHFRKLRCRKSARRCGAKHISKSKVQKTKGYGALLNVRMSFCVAGTKDSAPCQKRAKREGFVAVSTTTTTLHFTTLQLQLQLHNTSLHYTTLHFTTLHSTQLHYTKTTSTLHYTALHSTHYTSLHFTTLHYTSLHFTTLDYPTILDYTTTKTTTTLHYTTLITLHCTNYIRLHYTTWCYSTLH